MNLTELLKKEVLNEILIIVVASLMTGFILALKLKWPIVSIEAIDFLWMFLLSLLLFSVFVGAQKLTAYFLDCKTRSKLLSFRRYWFQPITQKGKAELPFDFPVWFVLPILLVLINFKWLAILNFDIEPKLSHLKRRWSNITESDVGKVAIAGPFATIILGLIFKIFGATNIAFLCVWFAFLALIPIGMGFKLLNSSRILWFFSLIFSLALLFLIKLSSALAAIIMALIVAAFITIIYYSLYEK